MSTGGADGLQAAIHGHVFKPSDPGFADVAHVFNTRFDHVLPDAVARPINSPDVRDAIRFTVAHGVAVRARSGGHSYAGYSTLAGGVGLDLRKLNWVNFDSTAGTATIGAGAQLIDVYAGLAKHGATLPGGTCPSVGVAGVTLGGGFGLASRHLGLTVDSLLAVKIVTADGQLRTVDQATDGDLLWALKGGGGGNFGVVTEFVFRAHPMPSTSTCFQIGWPWSSADEAIATWQSWAPHALTRSRRSCTSMPGPDQRQRAVSRLLSRHPRPGQPAARRARSTPGGQRREAVSGHPIAPGRLHPPERRPMPHRRRRTDGDQAA